MTNLSATIATYDVVRAAEQGWSAVEAAAADDSIDLADAALVTRNSTTGTITALRRQSHHGWGRGDVAGALVGLLYPLSILDGVVGTGGGVIVRLHRSLDRSTVRDLGKVDGRR